MQQGHWYNGRSSALTLYDHGAAFCWAGVIRQKKNSYYSMYLWCIWGFQEAWNLERFVCLLLRYIHLSWTWWCYTMEFLLAWMRWLRPISLAALPLRLCEVGGSDFVDYCAVNACVVFDVLESCDDSYGVGECLCGEVVIDVVAGC